MTEQPAQPDEGEQAEPEATTNDLSQQDDVELADDQTPAADLDEGSEDAEGNDQK